MNSINSKITNGVCPVCGDDLVIVNLITPQCSNCKEFESDSSSYPCKNCENGSHWTPCDSGNRCQTCKNRSVDGGEYYCHRCENSSQYSPQV